jgi:hypothetical protein
VTINPADVIPAAAFRYALLHNVLPPHVIVEWADARIDQRPSPEAYLIELSLSGDRNPLDVAGVLAAVGETADPSSVCDLLLSMLPDVAGFGFDRADRAAGRVSWLVRDLLNARPSPGKLDERVGMCYWLDEEFTLAADGILDKKTVVAEFQQFIDRYRSPEVAIRLNV